MCRRKRSQLKTAGFRPLGPLIGLNPAEMSPNQPVSGDLAETWIVPMCREDWRNPLECGLVLQAGGHRFDPGWLHHLVEGRTAPVPDEEAGASALEGRADRVRRLVDALIAAGPS